MIDAYRHQANVSPGRTIVEPYDPAEAFDGYTPPTSAAPKKQKTRKAASAMKQKAPGKIESFKLKERQVEYNRQAKELDQ